MTHSWLYKYKYWSELYKAQQSHNDVWLLGFANIEILHIRSESISNIWERPMMPSSSPRQEIYGLILGADTYYVQYIFSLSPCYTFKTLRTPTISKSILSSVRQLVWGLLHAIEACPVSLSSFMVCAKNERGGLFTPF